ncbi:MAG: ABC transporter permease [Candidatus Delongbacteria bacterium]|nr:ABC transporter permease [Candidatus Delongbacteria bacterium]
MKKIFVIFLIILILSISLPLLNMFLKVSVQDLIKTLLDEEVTKSIFLTLRASLWSTSAALIVGVPASYILARHNFFGKRILEGIIDIPVIVPHTAAGIALLTVLGRRSLFGEITGISIMGTETAISVGMFFVSVPFLINQVKTGFRLIDERYEKVAYTLGATPFQTFYKVSLPLVKKSIMSGSIMMWARGISEFGAVVILAYHPMIAPVLIYDRYESFGLNYARPVAVLLITICLIVFIVLRFVEHKSGNNAK